MTDPDLSLWKRKIKAVLEAIERIQKPEDERQRLTPIVLLKIVVVKFKGDKVIDHTAFISETDLDEVRRKKRVRIIVTRKDGSHAHYETFKFDEIVSVEEWDRV